MGCAGDHHDMRILGKGHGARLDPVPRAGRAFGLLRLGAPVICCILELADTRLSALSAVCLPHVLLSSKESKTFRTTLQTAALRTGWRGCVCTRAGPATAVPPGCAAARPCRRARARVPDPGAWGCPAARAREPAGVAGTGCDEDWLTRPAALSQRLG